jgi:hypothetical protein
MLAPVTAAPAVTAAGSSGSDVSSSVSMYTEGDGADANT